MHHSSQKVAREPVLNFTCTIIFYLITISTCFSPFKVALHVLYLFDMLNWNMWNRFVTFHPSTTLVKTTIEIHHMSNVRRSNFNVFAHMANNGEVATSCFASHRTLVVSMGLLSFEHKPKIPNKIQIFTFVLTKIWGHIWVMILKMSLSIQGRNEPK